VHLANFTARINLSDKSFEIIRPPTGHKCRMIDFYVNQDG
jgi:hypothetical protein